MITKMTLTVNEAVEASGISRTRLYQYMKDGELPVVKLGARTLIRPVDLEKFINDHVTGL